MKRVVGIAHGRAGRVGLVAGVIVAAVVGLSAPAFAHHSDVSGQTSCSDGSHLVTWSISNSESNQQMTIVSASAKVGAQWSAVNGYALLVGFSGTTTATSVVPGGTSGTITLTVNVSWPDHFTYQAQASVVLLSNCSTTTTQATTTTTYPVTTTTQCDSATTTTQPVTTTTHPQCECTTTTLPETTTTVAETTTSTTMPVTTTTDIHELGSTTIVTTTTHPKAKPTTTLKSGTTIVTTTQPTPIDGVLPHTGSNTTFPVIFGGLCIAAGAALAFRKRSAWSRP